MSITDVIPSSSAVEVSQLQIPFVLVDDDQTTTIIASDVSGVRSAFEEAYVLAVPDGGGKASNNAKSVPFVRNTPVDDPGLLSMVAGHWGSRNNESDFFWVAYVVSAHEFAPCLAVDGAIRGDGDPDREQPVYGITPPGKTTHPTNLAIGGDVSFIFIEAERDGRASAKRRIWKKFHHPVNVAHEVGHQFGLHHDQVGLMKGTLDLKTRLIFKPQSINLIRNRVKSPGGGTTN